MALFGFGPFYTGDQSKSDTKRVVPQKGGPPDLGPFWGRAPGRSLFGVPPKMALLALLDPLLDPLGHTKRGHLDDSLCQKGSIFDPISMNFDPQMTPYL